MKEKNKQPKINIENILPNIENLPIILNKLKNKEELTKEEEVLLSNIRFLYNVLHDNNINF